MKQTNEIMDLMRSDAYTNSNHPNHTTIAEQVSDYFNQKYGKSRSDATGRSISIRSVYIWHTESDENTCDECAALSGQVFERQEDVPQIPLHPNCRCWIEEVEVDDKNNPISDSRQEEIIKRTIREEGGYVDDPELIDQPTNTGITQKALNEYNKDNPSFNFPENLKDLSTKQAAKIYQEKYYKERRIDEIKNERIGFAVFDMGVMSNFQNVGRIVQQTLNESVNADLKTDGIMGDATIDSLNNISKDKIDVFMDKLIDNRIEYLQKLPGWDKYGSGWKSRTNRY